MTKCGYLKPSGLCFIRSFCNKKKIQYETACKICKTKATYSEHITEVILTLSETLDKSKSFP